MCGTSKWLWRRRRAGRADHGREGQHGGLAPWCVPGLFIPMSSFGCLSCQVQRNKKCQDTGRCVDRGVRRRKQLVFIVSLAGASCS